MIRPAMIRPAMIRPAMIRPAMIRASSRSLEAQRLFVALAFALGGAMLWLGAKTTQSALAPVLAGFPDWARLVLNAGLEETLRLALALAAAAAISRLGLKPRYALLGVLASCVFAGAEHISYLVAFPTADVYWRLGYSGPIHANAAALFAVALSSASPKRPGALFRAAGAFLLAWAWHAAFNLTAAHAPFPALPILGSSLNLAAMALLLWAAERRFVIGGTIHGRP